MAQVTRRTVHPIASPAVVLALGLASGSLAFGLSVFAVTFPRFACADTTVDDAAPSEQVEEEPGLALETAIPLDDYKGTKEGVQAEVNHIIRFYPGWKLGNQSLIEKNGRYYDVIEIEGFAGERKTLYFDITSWLEARFEPTEIA